MQTSIDALTVLESPNIKKLFSKLYRDDEEVIARQLQRYGELVKQYEKCFPGKPLHLFSSPGRTEIGGNHTDHNHGRVLAASVDLDSIAAVTETGNNVVTMFSEGFERTFVVDLNDLTMKDEEKGTTEALIRGIAARFVELGYNVGGFNAYVASDVKPGSGLSSSASIELLIGSVFNALYNENRVKNELLARIGQYAENRYFGKPCGLMDQMAIAIGSFVYIDFEDPQNPKVAKITYDINAKHYSLLVVDTNDSHADLTEEYTAIPADMMAVAREFSRDVCRQINFEQLLEKIPSLREKLGDRAILRALHFFAENDRVAKLVAALKQDDFGEFLNLINESGNSSFKWLQNCFVPKTPDNQGISLALALTDNYLAQRGKGACRVHGGGFAGTIQVFMHDDMREDYIRMIEKVFGTKSVTVLSIRQIGAICINPLL